MDPISALLALPGGWPFAVIALAGVGMLLLRGDLVVRLHYNAERDRANRLEAQLDRNTEAIDKLASDLPASLRDLRDEIRFGGRHA